MTMNQKEREELIAREYRGILPYYEAFYIASIIYAADRSDAAFQRFENALGNGEDASQTAAAVQEGLTHAGALSRFFWPMQSKNNVAASRGQRLCKAFELDDKSALKSRYLKNAFDYSDERLGNYLTQDRV